MDGRRTYRALLFGSIVEACVGGVGSAHPLGKGVDHVEGEGGRPLGADVRKRVEHGHVCTANDGVGDGREKTHLRHEH